MYISKLKKYKSILKKIIIIYFICYVFSLFFNDLAKYLIILFDAFVFFFYFILAQKTLINQDRYIEKNYNDVYKKFDYTFMRPIAISFRLWNKEEFIRDEIAVIMEESKDLIKLGIKVYITAAANTFIGGVLYFTAKKILLYL